MIVGITGLRMGFDPDEGDVEAAVREIDAPILFIAGSADRRMPVALAERMVNAAHNPLKELLVIPGASHGEAFSKDRKTYLDTVFRFLEGTTRSIKN
jgi:pimeloyl-ACP methyl ester carboxylesterase